MPKKEVISDMEMLSIFITFLFVLLVAGIFKFAGRHFKIPDVVASILAGIVIGLPAIKRIIIEPNTDLVFIVGDVGLFALMFLAGLETSWRMLYREKKDATVIALFGALFPFFTASWIFYLLGFSLSNSLIVGICISVTAEATKARVLLDLKKLRTKLGAAMMGAGVVDDTLGLLSFIAVSLFLGQAELREDLLAIGAILSFFVGIILQCVLGRQRPAIKNLEKILLLLIIPFFFVSLGIHFDINSLMLSPWVLLGVLILAVSGKLIGVFLTRPLTKFSWKQLYVVGWAMNSRGAVGMALALMAYRTGLINIELYSSLVITALVSTLAFPFIITSVIKKDPLLMGEDSV
ncbi:MAG: hypothetical protein GF375_05065 [Candidatus Omnitrophica bacterium]|nr:hypothetical protein [Candidatus Omnitrophota bacterium]MBD3269365.1 hypothetical protein [Candidatus Omnitrophota bacterium]